MDNSLIEKLNAPILADRLAAAKEVGQAMQQGDLTTDRNSEVNNHVHTRYSFSPYFPTMGAFKAWEAGLCTVGCIDHDSISGGAEMVEATACFGIGGTIGFEIRVNFDSTAIEGKKINNPDSCNVAYVVAHGVSVDRVEEAKKFLEPIYEARAKRNRKMIDALNARTSKSGLEALDFDKDVVPLSQADEGGSITERHLLYALVLKIIEKTGKGEPFVSFVENDLGVAIPDKVKTLLLDVENPHYEYDSLGVFKTTIIADIYIQPNNEEVIHVSEFIDFTLSINAIPAYAYLGDVINSATGDKKDEAFEDEYLDELMPEIKRLGFQAVTYMPPRNSIEQLRRVQALCRKYELMEISGVDINSSRQTFNCPIITEPDFVHLTTSTWALIAHEKLVNHDPILGLFHSENPHKDMPLIERIAKYAEWGKGMDCFNPDSIIALAKS